MDSSSESRLNPQFDSTADPGIRLEGRSILATRSKNNQVLLSQFCLMTQSLLCSYPKDEETNRPRTGPASNGHKTTSTNSLPCGSDIAPSFRGFTR